MGGHGVPLTCPVKADGGAETSEVSKTSEVFLASLTEGRDCAMISACISTL